MSSTKTSQVIEEKPKRALNAILKSMNDYRNNVIGAHIGTKAPRKTAPIFKLTLALARTQMGIDEKSKNTTEIVDKASEIFSSNPDKFVQLAITAQEAEAVKDDTSTKGKKKSTAEPKVNQKSKKASAKEDAIEVEEPIVKAKGKSKKSSAKEDAIEVEEPIVKAKGKSKKASAKEDAIKVEEPIVKAKVKKISVKKTSVKQIIDSDSNSDSDSDSDSD